MQSLGRIRDFGGSKWALLLLLLRSLGTFAKDESKAEKLPPEIIPLPPGAETESLEAQTFCFR